MNIDCRRPSVPKRIRNRFLRILIDDDFDTNFVLVVPTCMIGGCYWPVEFMNDSMQKISYFAPQRWVLDAMEQLAAGGSWSAIALHVIVLLLFGVILLGIGSTVLQPAKREAL